MDRYYKVQISYPNGQVEEVEETFNALDLAIQYGNSLLIQVGPNENFHEGLDEEEEPQEAYFFVIEVDEEKKDIVYDSRK